MDTTEEYEAQTLQDKRAGKKQHTHLPDAEEIYSHDDEHRIAGMSQLVALLDCFYAAVYVVHLHKLVAEAYDGDLFGRLLVSAMLLGPSVLLIFVIGPIYSLTSLISLRN